ncbi:MAG: hypothetical protein QXT72_00140 [Candidatus Micrarchaeia archaeon]
MRNLLKILMFSTFIISLIAAQAKMPTYILYADAKEQTNNNYNFSATLVSISVPEDRTTLKEKLETGNVDPSTIINNFKYSPILSAKILVYSINPANQEDKKYVCEFITAQDGRGSCIGRISESNPSILFIFEGNSTYAPSQFTISIPKLFPIPPLKDLVDASWLIIFLIIGTLIAALYASGRDPLASLDITTPKTRGPSYPKPQKIKWSKAPQLPLMVYSVPASTKIISATSALDRYVETKEEKKILTEIQRQAYINPSKASINLVKFVTDKGILNRLQQRKEWAAKQMKETEEKLKSQPSYPKGKLTDEKFRKRIEIQDLKDRLRMYREELSSAIEVTNKIISATAGTTATNLDPEVLGNTLVEAERTLLNEIKDKKHIDKETKTVNIQSLEKGLDEKVGELVKVLVPKDVPSEITNEQIQPLIKAKVELDRLYISKIIAAFNKMQPSVESLIKKGDINLSEIRKMDYIEKTKFITGLVDKIKPKRYKRINKEILQIAMTKEEYENMIEKLQNLLRQYKSAVKVNDEKTKDKLTIQIGFLYYQIVRRAKAYLENIKTGKYETEFTIEGLEELLTEEEKPKEEEKANE